MVTMNSTLPSQYLNDFTAASAPKFFVIPTSLNAVDNTSVSPASITGSRKRKIPAPTVVMTTSTTCLTNHSNVKLMNLKFDAPNEEWAVSGWESSAVYKLTLILTKAVDMKKCSAATNVGQS